MKVADLLYGPPHQPSASCHDDHCATHNRDEPISMRWIPGSRLCWECGHYYRSGLHLRLSYSWAYVKGWRQPWGSRRDLWWALKTLWRRKFYACPHCTHDF